jgi:hypothetical protein
MKISKFLSLIVLVLVSLFYPSVHAQIYTSSCEAHDSIVSKYRNDADRLAVRKAFKQNLSYKDSTQISKECSDTFLNALIAVYNAVDMPLRDTITSIYQVHTNFSPSLNLILIYADTSEQWVKNALQAIAPLGFMEFDSVFTEYNFELDYFIELGKTVLLVYKTETNLNLLPLITYMNGLNGNHHIVIHEGIAVSHETDIIDSIHSEQIDLTYSYAWGDCPSGCLYKRSWKVSVNEDCSVEFLGSWGPHNINVNNIKYKQIRIYPNPFNDYIQIEGVQQDVPFIIKDLTGKLVSMGISNSKVIYNLTNIESGIYFLELETELGIQTFKLIKN